MYHVKYSKPLHYLENKIKDPALSDLIRESTNINEFISTLGDSFDEIVYTLDHVTEFNYVLVVKRSTWSVELHTRENIFIINTEDLLFDDDSIEGLNFAVKLLNNLEAYDLVLKFD